MPARARGKRTLDGERAFAQRSPRWHAREASFARPAQDPRAPASARRLQSLAGAPPTVLPRAREDTMHDIDRSFMDREDESLELSGEGESYEYEAYEGEAAYEGQTYEGETYEGAYQGEAYEGEVLGEGELEQLASELLSISNEGELDHFLGSLIKKVSGAIGKVVKTPLGQQLGGMLKGLAQKALPAAGAALGNLILPGVGGAIGSKLASQAPSLFGLELEGLSQEDQQFEVAKQYVRLAGDAIRSAASAPGMAPADAARRAMIEAAQRFAPGLLSGVSMPSWGGANSGRWIRRGRRIVLYGV
jgi:hypothetical protein